METRGKFEASGEASLGTEVPRLRPDLTFVPLDDELIIFCEQTQKILGLNATAAALTREMKNGATPPALAAMMISQFGVSASDADAWVQATTKSLQSYGLLLDCPFIDMTEVASAEELAPPGGRAEVQPLEPFQPQTETHYRLLGTHARIRCAYRSQLRMIDAVIGHLKSEEKGEPTLTIDVEGTPYGDKQLRSLVFKNGVREAVADRLSHLGPAVKTIFWLTAVNSYDYLLNLHAGVVGRNGRCILLPAEAGSGKSSLTAALTQSGLGYYSDEVALVEAGTFLVRPMPLAVCIKSTGWETMSGLFPQLATLRTHIRDDGKIVRYVPPAPSAVQKQPGKVSHIFFPRYDAQARTELVSLSRSEAITRLLGQCVAAPRRLDPGTVQSIVDWIGSIQCYALDFSSLSEAVALVRAEAFP